MCRLCLQEYRLCLRERNIFLETAASYSLGEPSNIEIKTPEQEDLVEQEGEDSAACVAKIDDNDLLVTNSLKSIFHFFRKCAGSVCNSAASVRSTVTSFLKTTASYNLAVQ